MSDKLKSPPLVRWSDSLEIGVGYIDLEHRLLLMLVQKLDRAIRSGASKSTLVLTVTELFECTRFHFASEENLMRETGYPDLVDHQRVHSLLLNELSLMAGRINRGLVDPVETITFLRKWLIAHIMQMDRPVGDYIHGADPPRDYLAQWPFDDTFAGLFPAVRRSPNS